MSEANLRKVLAIGAPTIMAMILFLFAASYLLSLLFGLPFSLGLPIIARLFGVAVLLAGLSVMAWTMRTRSPRTLLVSTYITLTKLFRGTPIAEKAGRTEPLVVSGPQKYVRNPLYFGVVVMVLGWALLTAYSFVFIGTAVILLWFSLVIIPFEERELQALFGEQWRDYSEATPMLFPFTKRRRRVA
jgi:protein-S-isoprenylcysteine O-methyltransferase Ste14